MKKTVNFDQKVLLIDCFETAYCITTLGRFDTIPEHHSLTVEVCIYDVWMDIYLGRVH